LADTVAGRAAAWPTGEPGDARGDLARYDDLVPAAAAGDDDDRPADDALDRELAELERAVGEQVGHAVARLGEAARATRRGVDERRRDLEDRAGALDARAAALAAAERAVTDREAGVAEDRARLDAERQRIEEAAASFGVEELEKVRLDVGGSIYTTSTGSTARPRLTKYLTIRHKRLPYVYRKIDLRQ